MDSTEAEDAPSSQDSDDLEPEDQRLAGPEDQGLACSST